MLPKMCEQKWFPLDGTILHMYNLNMKIEMELSYLPNLYTIHTALGA